MGSSVERPMNMQGDAGASVRFWVPDSKAFVLSMLKKPMKT